MTALASLSAAVLLLLYGGAGPWLVAVAVVIAAVAGTTLDRKSVV